MAGCTITSQNSTWLERLHSCCHVNVDIEATYSPVRIYFFSLADDACVWELAGGAWAGGRGRCPSLGTEQSHLFAMLYINLP